MGMGTVIGVVGCDYEDIVVYTAKILCELGKKVVIVDRTEQEVLLEIFEIPTRMEQEREVRDGEFSGLFMTNQGINQEMYDVIFLVFGYRLMHPKLYECESLVMISDGMPARAAILKKLGQWERKQWLILRNLVGMRHTERYLAMLAGNEKDYYPLFYEEQDARVRYSLGAESGCGIRHLSKEMKYLLILLVQYIVPDFSDKEIRQVIRIT